MKGRWAIWGGAVLGLFVGLVLSFFIGSYWHTVLYSVSVGMAARVAAEAVGWLSDELRRLL